MAVKLDAVIVSSGSLAVTVTFVLVVPCVSARSPIELSTGG